MKKILTGVICFLFLISPLSGKVIQFDFMDLVGTAGHFPVNDVWNTGTDKEEDPGSSTWVSSGEYIKTNNGYYYYLEYGMPYNSFLTYQYVYTYFYYQSEDSAITKNFESTGGYLSFWAKGSSSLDGKTIQFVLSSDQATDTGQKNESYATITLSTK